MNGSLCAVKKILQNIALFHAFGRKSGIGKIVMPRPRQQVIEAFQEGEGRLLKEFSLDKNGLKKRNFIERTFNLMMGEYERTGNLEALLAGCMTLIEIIEKD